MFGIFFFFLARADKLLFPSFPSEAKKMGNFTAKKKKKSAVCKGVSSRARVG